MSDSFKFRDDLFCLAHLMEVSAFRMLSFFFCSRNGMFMCCIKAGFQSRVISKILGSSSSSFEGHPLQARHKQNWGRGFILLLPQTAALPGSDAGSDIIKPASSFVIQNRQTACSMWCPMYGAHC